MCSFAAVSALSGIFVCLPLCVSVDSIKMSLVFQKWIEKGEMPLHDCLADLHLPNVDFSMG